MNEFQTQIAATADRAMPQFIVQELPHGIAGLIVAGLLAAAMSGLSSGMNGIASVLITKFPPGKSRFKIFREGLWLERFIGVSMGALGILLAVGITISMQRTNWNLVELSGRLVNLFAGPLAVLFFAGLLLKRSNALSVLVGFALSVTVSIFIGFSNQIFGFQSLSFTWIIPVSFIVGFVVTWIISIFAGNEKEVVFETKEEAEIV